MHYRIGERPGRCACPVRSVKQQWDHSAGGTLGRHGRCRNWSHALSMMVDSAGARSS